ncbi:MAG: proteasome accessory factor PafA2 family protein [Pirellulaceae bacterium]
MPILDRLVGLETEYAIRFHPRDGAATSPGRFQLYQALVARLKRHVLTAPAKHFKQGVFLANGGAVWFEAERPAAGGGLVEGATPECRGPLEVVRFQRAQDQLLSQCARLADVDGLFSLIKNDRDGQGHVYGAQENYEAILGTSWSLGLWRLGLILLAPLVVLTWLGVGLMIVGILVYLAVAGLIYLPLQWLAVCPRNVALLLFGRDLVEGRETGSPTPVWLETSLLWCTRLVHAPLAFCLLSLISLTAFRRIRRQLLPFLVSRCVVAGAGMVDEAGNYVMADKAPAINCVLGLGGFLRDRPIFTFGHFFKAICVESWLSPRDYFHLLRPRQRLQIGLGDSNMAEMAEFLRVGSTALVLDVIEAGELPPIPALRKPVQALHQLCSDPTLACAVPLVDGRQVTALQLQRLYLQACQQFLERRPDAPAEAQEVVAAWEEVLDALEHLQLSGEAPQSLIGSVDWVTKQHLLEEAGRDASWEARKKIDICYHELSPLGYFQMLQAAGLAAAFTSPQELERAMRTPPANTPATMRGHFIREFSSDTDELSVNWKCVVLGRGFGSKSIRLARYDRPAHVPTDPQRQGTHDPGRSNMP